MRFIITIWQWLGFSHNRVINLRPQGCWGEPSVVISLIIAVFAVSVYSVPLPKQNATQERGLAVGLGFGSMVNTKCRSLWTWNAQATYYYNSFFAGGTGLKFMGGNLDSANNLIYQRYSLQGYFYTDKQKYALFISPIFSFDNTSLSTLSDEFRRIGNDYEIPAENEIRTNTECRELFEEIGSSIGYQTGLGYQITPIWGFSFGHSTDWIFKGNYIVSFSGSFAFNLREFSQRLLDNTQNLYVFLEYSNSFTKFSNPMHFLILGFMVGF